MAQLNNSLISLVGKSNQFKYREECSYNKHRYRVRLRYSLNTLSAHQSRPVHHQNEKHGKILEFRERYSNQKLRTSYIKKYALARIENG